MTVLVNWEVEGQGPLGETVKLGGSATVDDLGDTKKIHDHFRTIYPDVMLKSTRFTVAEQW